MIDDDNRDFKELRKAATEEAEDTPAPPTDEELKARRAELESKIRRAEQAMTDEQNSVTPDDWGDHRWLIKVGDSMKAAGHRGSAEALYRAAEALREAQERAHDAERDKAAMMDVGDLTSSEERAVHDAIHRKNKAEAERDRLAEENRRLLGHVTKAEQIMRRRSHANTQRSDHASRSEVYTMCADLLARALSTKPEEN